MKHALILGPYNRNVHSHHLRPMLRLSATVKMPAEGTEPVTLKAIVCQDGKRTDEQVDVKVWVARLVPGRKVHRVRAECPFCKVEVSAGRLFQHRCN